MAQYQKPFYSTSFYGRLNAFVGEYETEVFDAQEVFTSDIHCEIKAQLPSVFYSGSAREIKYDSDWNLVGDELQTNASNATIEMEAAGDYFEAHIRYQDVENHKVLIELYQEDIIDGKVNWVKKEEILFDTYAPTKVGSIEKVKFNTYGFTNHKIVVKTKSVWNKATITFVGFSLQATNVYLRLRAADYRKEWTEYQDIQLAQTMSGSIAYLNGISGIFEDVRYIQGLLVLMSSDNQASPTVEGIEFHSSHSELYDYDGEYTVEIDVSKIVDANNKVFKKVSKIKWEESTPVGTELVVRSSSSYDGVFWGAISAPYSKSANRIRLKKGVQKHNLTIGPIDESTRFSHTKVISYNGLESESYFPKDEKGCSISYTFSRTRTNQKHPENLLQFIENPTRGGAIPIEFTPQPYYLTVELERPPLKESPVIDLINIYQNIEYKEEVRVIDKDISGVDNLGTGIVPLQKISDYSFTFPNTENENEYNRLEIDRAEQSYLLSDYTDRPTDLMLYFESEKDQANRSNKTTNVNDVVLAKTIVRKIEQGETQGVVKHTQYSTGNVAFLRPVTKEMDSSFTPTLQKGKKYRYYIQNGWPDDIHIVVSKQTLLDIAMIYKCKVEEIENLNPDTLVDDSEYLIVGQRLRVPNKTINERVSVTFANNKIYTEKSSHNAVFANAINEVVNDFSSENVEIFVVEQPDKGYVEWVSAEKIYKGVINLGDNREPFVRTQLARSTYSTLERKYTVQEEDTWEKIAQYFDVNVADLKYINTETDLVVGTVIKIPMTITLPEIPGEVEFDGERIYNISIIEDSVYKKTGEKLPESVIPIDWKGKHIPLTVKYRKDGSTELTAEIVRGANKNGMDALPHSQVREIISVTNKKTGEKYVPYSDALGTGDYLLFNNYVSWAPTEDTSLEPEAGETYVVTYTKEEVESVSVYLDTTYSEKIGADYAWRSPEIKIIEGICTPNKDFLVELPAPETYRSYSSKYKDIGYVIEDNDIWVETSMREIDGKSYLYATLNGKDPAINWHPTIHPGHYYLREDEYYMYSEPLRTTISQKELPHTENVEYVTTEQGIGALLLPPSNNLIKDSVFEAKEKKTAYIFAANSI